LQRVAVPYQEKLFSKVFMQASLCLNRFLMLLWWSPY